jgi:hypothetical protein
MKDRNVKKSTKIKIAETIIFPTVTQGSESWTVRKRERKKFDAFELLTWRRISGVSWTEKKTNFSGLEEVKPKRSLEATILRLNLRYFVHVMRTKGHWNGTLCLDKLKDTVSRENHGCDGLTTSRKQPAYDWKT